MTSNLHRGVFSLSLDFELAWGSRDLFEDDSALVVDSLATREQVFEPLVGLLESLEIQATWATVGHLFLDRADDSPRGLHPDHPTPQHSWRSRPWFDGVPAGTEDTHPAWYGRSLVKRLAASGQEVGSHSFSHVIFGDPGCSEAVADAELARCQELAAELGLPPLRSYVFPRNEAGHVHLLARHGFTSWRPREPAWFNDPDIPKPVSRAAHLASVISASTPPTVVSRQGAGGLWEHPGSATFLPHYGVRKLIPIERRVTRCVRGIDAAAERREVFHLYAHPINFATAPTAMLDGLAEVLAHAVRLRDRGRLDIWSMGQLTEHCARS